MLSRQLEEAMESVEIDPSDEELLAVAAKLAASDPKKRFGAQGLRRALAEKHGASWLVVKGETIEKRIERLTKERKLIAATARGYWKIAKSVSGSGIEFRPASGGSFDIFLDGEEVGQIEATVGEFKNASSWQRKKAFEVTLDIPGKDFTGKDAPPSFDTATDAKKWVQRALSR